MREGEIYITVDIDWAPDDILEHTIQLLERRGVAATFFVTHATPLLERIRSNPQFELGIHPNFAALLNGKSRRGEQSISSILRELLEVVPEARSVRSHALIQGSRFCEAFAQSGLRYDCNPFIPVTGKIVIRPWRFRNGMIVVPFMWSDYMHCAYGWDWNIDGYLHAEGLKVFAFHPIHVAINTVDLSLYHDNKDSLKTLQDTLKIRVSDDRQGAGTFLCNLLDKADEDGFDTHMISNITEEAVATL
ncbi:MAG: hypothetical protein GQ522_05365 [Deltaproteobacteria bacterium]|nr:hypothetical protein [Deltaproteobacteria bacterium]